MCLVLHKLFARWIMAEFYFDDNGGFVTANGALTSSGFCSDKAFAIGYFKNGCLPIFAKIPPVITGGLTDKIHVLDLGRARYRLSFLPSPASLPSSEIIFQTNCKAGNVTHLVTHCCRGDYFLVIETEEEIHEFSCPCALSDIKVFAVTLSKGHLIRITARAENKKFIALVCYNGDYYPLYQTVCDDFFFDGPELVCTRTLGGCNTCVLTERLSYKDGKFVPSDKSFLYRHSHPYPDELIAYGFLERLIFGDSGGAEEYLARGFSLRAAKEILGDFDSVADYDEVYYRPFVAGIFKKAPYCKAEYFVFDVKDGLISSIRPCRI